MAATDVAVPGGHEHSPPGSNFLTASHGLKSWLLTLDHKRIGLMYLASVLFAFGLGGTFALLLRLELLTPGKTFVDAKTYNQFFTLHGTIMVFFGVVPLGFAAGYTIGSGFRPHGSSNTGVALGFAGALLGPAAGVNLVGNGGPSRGNFGAAVGGAAVGYAGTYLAFRMMGKIPSTKMQIVAGIAALALPAVGATVAYNGSRR